MGPGLCRRFRRLLLAVTTFVTSALSVSLDAPTAFGWGVGHSTQAQLVLDGLPQEIRDFFSADLQRQIVRDYCGFPDAVRAFDESQLGKHAVEELKRLRLTPGELHEDLNVAISFLFLNRAFAEKNASHAAVWLGSLIHTIGDDGSHLTLMAYLLELNRFKGNVQIRDGSFDLSQVPTSGAGRAMLRKLMAGYMPSVISEDAEPTLRKLILLAYEEMDFGAQRQSRIGQTFNVDCPPTATEDGMLALAEIGAEGAQRILDATVTAWELAKRNARVQLTEDVIKQARAEVQQYLNAKPLNHDAVYAGTLDSQPAGPFVGVVVEPSTFMGRARFGYCGAVLLGQILRTLQDARVPCRALDIRRVEKAGLPPAEQMPALVVVSGGFSCSTTPFEKFVTAGGRLLWIGGCDKGLLGELSRALQPADPKLLPVSNKYEDANREVVAKVAIKFLNDFQAVLGAAPLPFVNNPNTFGWTTPRCGLQVRGDDVHVMPLAAVTAGTEEMTIAAALREHGQLRHVFLPQYLLLPYALTKDPPMDFSRPVLDSVGRKLVLGAIQMLAPGLVP
jgi:hypothetical protein